MFERLVSHKAALAWSQDWSRESYPNYQANMHIFPKVQEMTNGLASLLDFVTFCSRRAKVRTVVINCDDRFGLEARDAVVAAQLVIETFSCRNKWSPDN